MSLKISAQRWLLAALLWLPCRTLQAGPGQTLTGLDALVAHDFFELQGKRIGLITNQTGKTRDGRGIVEAFAETSSATLVAVFSPEHGFFGTIEDAWISSGALRLGDGRFIPLYSLYGSTLSPTADMLAGLDALVFDMQDVGARFYTYATTMGLAMEAAAAHDLDFYVLDRPNPIRGDIIEGPVLSAGIRHFTAYFPVPVRHGLTMGEIARLHNVMKPVGARLRVIPLKDWSREQWYDQTGIVWTRPSPNMPDVDAATLYPGIACFEPTNLSVGRGTEIPFRWVGASWFKSSKVLKRMRRARLPGIAFDREAFTPAKSLYAGRKCPGLRMRITNRDELRPLAVFAHLICAVRDLHPGEFEVRWDEMPRMVGTDRFRGLYESGAGPKELIELFDAGAREFAAARGPFLLY